MVKFVPCLWFEKGAEEAAKFYTSIFKNSKINKIVRYGNVGQEIHGQKPGSVMTVDFEIDGYPITALNGGPYFKLNEAFSLQVFCETQEEIDYYWEKLSEGGDAKAQNCGWLKDKFGMSWQTTPSIFPKLLEDPAKFDKLMTVLFKMKKIEIKPLMDAWNS